MRKKLLFGLVVLIIGLLLSGCELSASTPQPDSNNGDDSGFPANGDPDLESILAAQATSQAQTQYALSIDDSGGGDEPVATTPVAVVDTPSSPG